MTAHVWYAAYGSNVCRDRFLRYLQGGTVAGRTAPQSHRGARDREPPSDDRPFRLPLPLFFAGSSRSWNGGAVAFVDPEPAPDAPGARGRIWRVTRRQFDDVFRQENGLDVPKADDPTLVVDWSRLAEGSHLDVTDRWYGRVIHLGSGPDGAPVATFTTADANRLPTGPAADAYLRTIGTGLAESWGDDPGTAAAYLAACPGNAGALTASDVTAWLTAP
ncbi:MAG: histone deacetylase [Actinomycetota bacterium]